MPLDPAIKSLIAQFRKSPEWDEHLDLELLQKLWPSLVGDQLAAATQDYRDSWSHSCSGCARSGVAQTIVSNEGKVAPENQRALGRASNHGDRHYL